MKQGYSNRRIKQAKKNKQSSNIKPFYSNTPNGFEYKKTA